MKKNPLLLSEGLAAWRWKKEKQYSVWLVAKSFSQVKRLLEADRLRSAEDLPAAAPTSTPSPKLPNIVPLYEETCKAVCSEPVETVELAAADTPPLLDPAAPIARVPAAFVDSTGKLRKGFVDLFRRPAVSPDGRLSLDLRVDKTLVDPHEMVCLEVLDASQERPIGSVLVKAGYRELVKILLPPELRAHWENMLSGALKQLPFRYRVRVEGTGMVGKAACGPSSVTPTWSETLAAVLVVCWSKRILSRLFPPWSETSVAALFVVRLMHGVWIALAEAFLRLSSLSVVAASERTRPIRCIGPRVVFTTQVIKGGSHESIRFKRYAA